MYTRKVNWGLVPRVFIGCWSHRHPLFSMYQFSRLPERKQMFNIIHKVCTSPLAVVNHSYLFWEWWEPSEIQVPRSQPRTNLVRRSIKKKNSQASYVKSFLVILIFRKIYSKSLIFLKQSQCHTHTFNKPCIFWTLGN